MEILDLDENAPRYGINLKIIRNTYVDKHGQQSRKKS